MAGAIERLDNVTKEAMRQRPDDLFVFEDNMARRGSRGQAREIRGEPNALGIPASWDPKGGQGASFSDADWDKPNVRRAVTSALDQIERAVADGQTVVVASDGVGAGQGKLAQNAPAIARFIDERLKAIEAGQAATATANAAAPAGSAAVAGGAPLTPDEQREGVRGLLQHLDAARPRIQEVDTGLARRIADLSRTATPDRIDTDNFRTGLAYAFQDAERAIGPVAGVPQALRDDLALRAATYPGLENARLRELVAMTPAIDDRGLIRDIRQAASDVARGGGEQDTQDIASRIDVLENRLRLSPRPADQGPNGPERDWRAEVEPQQKRGQPPEFPAGQRNSNPAHPATTGETAGAAGATALSGTPIQTVAQRPAEQVPQQSSPLHNVFSALNGVARSPDAFDRRPTPLLERFAGFEAGMENFRAERQFKAAERAGEVLLSAVQEMTRSSGAAILQRISDAAKADPGGMQAVLSEMRPGGRFADLRGQLNAKLAEDRPFSRAFETVENAAKQFDRTRVAAATTAMVRPDRDALMARFEAMDEAVGRAISETPSRHDGKSMVEELSQKAREIAEKAMEAIKAAASRVMGKDPQASVGPSPG